MDRDAEAIGLVLAGDREAYRWLVEAHYAYAFRIACRLLGNEDDAEEVTQEAFLRAYRGLATFRKDAQFSTWVNRIVMNTAINLLERRKRDVLDGADGEAANRAWRGAQDGAAGPERLLLNAEATTLRQQAMAQLTPMERTAFTLRHMEEMPIAEIAEALKVPANSAKQAVFRAVSKLRRSLAPAMGGVR